MAIFVLTDAVITVNAVELSNRSNKVELNFEIDSVEVTTMGAVGHVFAGGLQNNSCAVDLFQDFATSNVEATIYPLVGTTTSVTVKATSAATSATNPLYTLSGTFLAAHTPVSGSTGDVAMTSLSFTGGTLVKTTA